MVIIKRIINNSARSISTPSNTLVASFGSARAWGGIAVRWMKNCISRNRINSRRTLTPPAVEPTPPPMTMAMMINANDQVPSILISKLLNPLAVCAEMLSNMLVHHNRHREYDDAQAAIPLCSMVFCASRFPCISPGF